ncbi:MAG TPA: DivIVA domain-containing protein [Actinomycetota bacterium]|nr:DivIVA domain-containing protein [Actinomycetota bacterium]
MSRAELDLPVLASPEQIRRREFVTTRRGYDQDQVRDYLDQVATQVERMQEMLRQARREAENAVAARSNAASGDPYEQFAARLGGLIRAAEDEAERIRREARDEAERVLREARADADRIRLDAQSKAEEARESAERALREAREAADRTIAGLDLRRNALMEQLTSMQERLLTAARELGSAIERHQTVNLTEVEAGAESVAVREHRAEEGGARAEPQLPATATDEPRADGAGQERDPARRSVEDLWSETDAVDLTIPDIPPLDLGWGDEDE